MAARSRANTADIALSNEPAAPISIEMSNVASNNNSSDGYTKVCTQDKVNHDLPNIYY